MVAQAREELAKISAEDRDAPAALDANLAILYASENWQELEEAARTSIQTNPEQIQGWLSLAFAMRRTAGVAVAKETLLAVDHRFGDVTGILHFNLACYHCLLSETDEAIARIRRALKLDPNLKALALEDDDLKPLWPIIQGIEAET
jgi:tetratricopeptide (TPR) repeat protein